MELTYRIEDRDKEWKAIYLSGDINEDAEHALDRLKSELAPKCIFNLKEVTSINSCGVRTWINFIRDTQKERSFILEECTPEVVSQINMIPNFKGQAKIHSVYASYVCDNCDIQKLHLFEEGKNLPTKLNDKLAEVNCDKCHEAMEMEELEEEFFAWLNH